MALELTALDAGFAPVERAERRDLRSTTAAVAGGVFLAALAIGAVVAPSAPSPLSPRLRVHEYFVAHHDAALNQSLLVHGVAGLAIAVLVVSLWRAGVHRRLFLVAGLAAAAASFVQLFFVVRIEQHIEHGIGVRQTDALFDAFNRATALKLVLVAVAVAAATSFVPRRLRWIAYTATPVLVLMAATLVTSVPSAHLLLTLSRA